MNQAIALLALQRYEPAQAAARRRGEGRRPQNARAWYNLGLLQKSLGNAEASLAAFTRAAELAPADAHARYFVGLMAARSSSTTTRSRRSRGRSRSIRSSCRRSSAWRARTSAREAGRGEDAPGSFHAPDAEKVASRDEPRLRRPGAAVAGGGACVPPAGATPPRSRSGSSRTTSPFACTGVAARRDPRSGAGGCVFDADGDGTIDYLRAQPARRASGDAVRESPAGGQFARAAHERPRRSSGVFARAPSPTTTTTRMPDSRSVATTGVCAVPQRRRRKLLDVTAKSGLPAAIAGGAARRPRSSTSITTRDVDLDRHRGRDDAPAVRNNGNGTFTDVTAGARLRHRRTRVGVVGKRLQQRSRDRPRADRRDDVDPDQPARRRVQDARRSAPTAPATTRGVVVVRLRQGRLDGSGVHAAGAPGAVGLAQREGHSRSSAWISRPRPSPRLRPRGRSTTTTTAGSIWPPRATAPSGGVLQVLRNVQGRFTDASSRVGATALSLKQPARGARRRSRRRRRHRSRSSPMRRGAGRRAAQRRRQREPRPAAHADRA